MKIKLLSNGAKVPSKADKGAAGYDLYVPKDVVIYPGRNIVPLDFSIALQHGYEADIRSRSGFAAKGMEGFPMFNNMVVDGAKPRRFNADVLLGCIDESYRGNVGVIIKSYETVPFMVEKGTRIAQMVIQQCYMGDLEQVDSLDETERADGGFGHTGIK